MAQPTGHGDSLDVNALKAFFKEKWTKSTTRASPEALALIGQMVQHFVHEAIHRAMLSKALECPTQDNDNDDDKDLDLLGENLGRKEIEAILPQLYMDFT